MRASYYKFCISIISMVGLALTLLAECRLYGRVGGQGFDFPGRNNTQGLKI